MAEQKPHEDANGEKTALLVLVQSLNDMRDVLVECSLILQDAYFDFEVEQRNAAAAHLNNVMQKMSDH